MVKKFQGTYHPHRTYSSSGDGRTVILYQPPSETAPLLQGETRRKRAYSLGQIGTWLLALCFLLTIYPISMHIVKCPPDPATRDATRRDWEIEKAHHDNLEGEWELKREEQSEKEEDWRREAEQHEREWNRETERHIREFEDLVARERKQRELERERWRREVEERDKREEEERQRRHMFWDRVEAHACTTYATREYTAQLMNLPRTWEHRLDACKATPLEIHGNSYLPTTCEDRGPGAVTGRWVINHNEPDCTTFWDSYDDKGCTSRGNLKEFCATTPTQINHRQFSGAEACFTAVWGVYGQWELDEGSC
ncbi:hypothetical protein V8E55_003148 [Tylopilus felleus]